MTRAAITASAPRVRYRVRRRDSGLALDLVDHGSDALACALDRHGDAVVAFRRRRQPGEVDERAPSGAVVGAEHPARAIEHADVTDLRVDSEGIDRLLARGRVVEVDRGRDRAGEDLRRDLRLAVAVGAKRHLILEDDRETGGEDRDGDEEDGGGSGTPFAKRVPERPHRWFTPIARASRRELIVRPRAWAWALSMKKRTRPPTIAK